MRSRGEIRGRKWRRCRSVVVELENAWRREPVFCSFGCYDFASFCFIYLLDTCRFACLIKLCIAVYAN